MLLKDIGSVLMSPGQDTTEDAGSRTLDDVKHVIGDFIDVAIFSNHAQVGPRGYTEGPRGSFSRGGGPIERGRGRGDSYWGGSTTRGRLGRNGFDDRIPGGPRSDRDRDIDRGGRW
jgi:Sin3 associated polypeptide p18 (SAP18)